ncbi:MAG: traA, partial [Myxococcaceae bacterium]|nr:traA [Myxococcaceae bacterium]
MANYGFRAQIFQRSLGQSVIDKAAYRSGSRLFDERLQLTSNYERKSGVLHTEILAPSNAPAWVLDREVLWNSVERAEKRCDARLAREIQFDLPNELSRPAQLALTREFLQREFVAKGMIADFALHEEKPHHPHIHCMLSTRDIGPTGWGNKRRDWDRRTQLLQWRAAWAHAANRALANEGHEARIDHRSYAARGIELEPQKKRYRIDTGRTVRTRERAQTQEAEIAALRQRNGDRIIARPALVPELLASSRATFSERDIRRIVEQQTHST